jgi:hypothetical protein
MQNIPRAIRTQTVASLVQNVTFVLFSFGGDVSARQRFCLVCLRVERFVKGFLGERVHTHVCRLLIFVLFNTCLLALFAVCMNIVVRSCLFLVYLLNCLRVRVSLFFNWYVCV